MNDFKVGDIVRIVRTLEPTQTLEQYRLKKNDIGTVIRIENNTFNYPIAVQFEARQLECAPIELEHINKLTVELI